LLTIVVVMTETDALESLCTWLLGEGGRLVPEGGRKTWDAEEPVAKLTLGGVATEVTALEEATCAVAVAAKARVRSLMRPIVDD